MVHQPGALEVEMGNMIPLLQQMSNFSERCNQVVLNLVQQLCSLYSTRWHLYQRVYKNVQMVPVYESLADLFEVRALCTHRRFSCPRSRGCCQPRRP